MNETRQNSTLRLLLLFLALLAIAYLYTHLDQVGDWLVQTFFGETMAQIEQIMEVP